jgi:hypothetical protein
VRDYVSQFHIFSQIDCRYYADHLKFLNRRQCKEELKEKTRKASKLKEEVWGPAKEFERVMLQKHISRYTCMRIRSFLAEIYCFYRAQGGVLESKPLTQIMDYSTIND